MSRCWISGADEPLPLSGGSRAAMRELADRCREAVRELDEGIDETAHAFQEAGAVDRVTLEATRKRIKIAREAILAALDHIDA